MSSPLLMHIGDIYVIIGDILQVVPRLDARYDWQPAAFKSLPKSHKTKLLYIEDACHVPRSKMKKTTREVALVSSEGHCTIFEKVSGTFRRHRNTLL